jgi:hypothetical protein
MSIIQLKSSLKRLVKESACNSGFSVRNINNYQLIEVWLDVTYITKKSNVLVFHRPGIRRRTTSDKNTARL